jgi:hypothetical protein
VTLWPSGLAYSRLEREARKRSTTPNLLLGCIVEILASDDMWSAVIDD